MTCEKTDTGFNQNRNFERFKNLGRNINLKNNR